LCVDEADFINFSVACIFVSFLSFHLQMRNCSGYLQDAKERTWKNMGDGDEYESGRFD